MPRGSHTAVRLSGYVVLVIGPNLLHDVSPVVVPHPSRSTVKRFIRTFPDQLRIRGANAPIATGQSAYSESEVGEHVGDLGDSEQGPPSSVR